MQHQNLFVFDIETIPDTDAVPNLTGFDDPDIAARRIELERYHLEITDGRNAFPRQPFHKVVAISFLEADLERDGPGEAYLLRELRTGGEAGFNEKQLLQGFFTYFERHKPRLVSYNGRGFDLPVLKYRAMKHGISAPWLYQAGDKWNSYNSRYSADWHCDLLEVLADYGASAKVKLNEVCSVMGFPGKFGVDGSQVYLRLMHHKGTISTEAYNRGIADIVSLIKTEGAERPHLTKFLEAWGESSNNTFTL